MIDLMLARSGRPASMAFQVLPPSVVLMMAPPFAALSTYDRYIVRESVGSIVKAVTGVLAEGGQRWWSSFRRRRCF